ncbi:S10 family peptidase [Amycolatopsis vancoresmycina]|uniref:Peptidase S10, serine carboxypeptidase n=1 Tax=Amycolatopsis vancoresmycina DSM 44592 TaxID=1292037 RepID=R1GDQ0_9PSEU|nr:peptidase S10 [Amycolatopsis vancoresmycina]EOD69383.1 peptidase S10, serine carboxypeptidase [Amycolatopsis vancoresmycina DSM 44592]
MADTTPEEAPEKKAAETTEIPAEPTDDIVTTQHTLTVKRKKLAYTAKAGRIVLRKEIVKDGKSEGFKAKAEVFVTSYTLDDADPGSRPVTFAFNGGPGSSSIWLHMGLLGPRRVLSGDVDDLVPPPYGLADNPETLLAHSDLVFIDPVSTGYSRASEGGETKDFHGFKGDIESVGEVIRLWVSRHQRWLSPKFLAGESYGTLRAAGLAAHLQDRHGLYLNGLLLISSVLDLGTLQFTEGNDLPYSLYVPTYAAIAHYHGLHGERPLDDVLADAEDFAAKDLPWALARGARLSTQDRAEAVATLASLTGLSESYVDRVNLRIEHVRFFTELLRDRGLVVGRMDGRFTTWEPDGGREHMSDDPSISRVVGAYAAAFNHYVRAELGYENDLPYEIISEDTFKAWSYSDFEGRSVSVVDSVSAAMRANPHLQVHVAFGHYDGATAYYAAEHVLAHLHIPEELRDNIDTAYYPAGHMMYVHEPTRVQQSKDLAKFVKKASNR